MSECCHKIVENLYRRISEILNEMKSKHFPLVIIYRQKHISQNLSSTRSRKSGPLPRNIIFDASKKALSLCIRDLNLWFKASCVSIVQSIFEKMPLLSQYACALNSITCKIYDQEKGCCDWSVKGCGTVY